MNLSGVVSLSIIVYATIWIALVAGVALVRTGNKRAKRIRTWLINKRIEQFQHPPFKNLLRLWLAGRFFRTSFCFIVVIILPAVLLFFLLGLLLITPILAIYQGFVVGLLIAHYDRRHVRWAMMVVPFEVGYWVLSGALGMSVTAGLLLDDLSLTQSLLEMADVLASGYRSPSALR